jgi:uncharacterized protein
VKEVFVVFWCFLVAFVGTTLGLILGTLRLPVLVLLASSPAAGAAANVGVSAVTAATASIAHIRAGRVNWRLVAWMTPPSVVGAAVGGYTAGVLPSRVLLAMIGSALVILGFRMMRRRKRPPRTERLRVNTAVVTGFVVGLLGGLIGLILGTLRLPALIGPIGETEHRAVGTNVVVGFWLGVAAVLGHLPTGVDWSLMALGSAASIPGALAGARLTGRLSDHQLRLAIAVILVIVGATMVGQAAF